jgi:TonB family protein
LLLVPGLAFAAPPQARVLVGTLRPPLAVAHRVLPDYPKAARMAFVEGDVLVTARVSPGGAVDQLEVRQGEPVLVDAARAAVRDWRFASPPATTRVAIPFQFRLDLDLAVLLDRAAGLTVSRLAGDSLIASMEVPAPAVRARLAGRVLAAARKRGAGARPRDAAWSMSWKTQGRTVTVLASERAVVVRDGDRAWAGSDRKRVLVDELEGLLPLPR